MKGRRPPFRPVLDDIRTDVLECLEQLHIHAAQGQNYGVAFVAMYKRRRYIANSAGECARNPTFTRGLVAALDDHLRDKMRAS
jgi:hypothetical protein